MTNGEIIQNVFTCEVCEPIPEDDIIHVIFSDKSDSAIGFDWSWWNMEYKEPTTKNDLGVDYISREAVFETIDDCNRDGLKGIFCSYDDGERFKEYIKNLPSVTPQLSSELEKNSKKLEKDFGELDCISRADAIRVASGYCHPSNVAKELAKLPSVKPQPCEDVISRQALLNSTVNKNDIWNIITDSKGENLEAIISKLPSVTPQEPKIVPIAEIKFDEDKLKEFVNKAVLTVTQQEPCEDAISRKSIKQKLQEHHDFFVNAYGGFSNLPQNDKSRVDEITNCIAMVVNEPPVTPQEPFKPMVEIDPNSVIKQDIIDRYKAESEKKRASVLERASVLDKIRAEIAHEIIPRNSDQYDHEAMWQNMGLRMALKAIDKLKAETEDT